MTTRKKTSDPFQFFVEFNETVGAFYAQDQVRAGLVTSHLGPNLCYISVARYPMGQASKQVVTSTRASTFELALIQLAQQWADKVRPPPRERLVEELDRRIKAWG